MKPKTYIVRAWYDAKHYPEMDDVVEKAAGCESDDSGIGFGFRDMNFRFSNKVAATSCAKRIGNLSRVYTSSCISVELETE